MEGISNHGTRGGTLKYLKKNRAKSVLYWQMWTTENGKDKYLYSLGNADSLDSWLVSHGFPPAQHNRKSPEPAQQLSTDFSATEQNLEDDNVS